MLLGSAHTLLLYFLYDLRKTMRAQIDNDDSEPRSTDPTAVEREALIDAEK